MNKELLSLIEKRGSSITVPKGQEVFSEGGTCSNFIIVTNGSLKVFKVSSKGNEMTLYRVNNENLCILTSTCILAGSIYPATGVTETEVSAIVLSKKEFDNLILENTDFRYLVFSSLSNRFANFIEKINEISFSTLGQRLVNFLSTFKNDEGLVQMTHQKIADELGSERESVSRLLKNLESKGIVEISRGSVRLLN